MSTKRKVSIPPIGGQPAAIVQLRELILEKGIPLTELAKTAMVSYVPLWKFSTGRQKSYNLLDAERVFYTITGRTFLPAVKPTIKQG
jgi:predicted transcriptional regulator